jgi:tRNA nucleotidyltransferase/poly(A) polymerase
MNLYEVGGCVRDELLGIKSKDIDFAVVLDSGSYSDPFAWMIDELWNSGFSLFKETIKPEFFTARGLFPKDHPVYPGKPADFVLARKESGYSDGRRPDSVKAGTLEDDLARRDFTMNAIAKTPAGGYIDPHGGMLDIQRKIVRAVGDPFERLSEDPLRALRALRFTVTKGFSLDFNLALTLREGSIAEGVAGVSDERITKELSEMFRFDTTLSLLTLSAFPTLMAAAFSGKVSLDATMKQKGRG